MKYVIPFISFFLIAALVPSLSSAQSIAPLNNPCTVDQNGAIVVDSDLCQSAPQNYQITIFEIGLCESDVVIPPTSSVPADLSRCSVVFSNPTGNLVNLSGSSALRLSGDVLAPNPGTYRYAYVYARNVGGVSGSWSFSTPMKGTNGVSGTICWTVDSEITNYDKEKYFDRNINGTFRQSVVDTVECGSAIGTVGVAKTNFNSLDSNDPVYATNQFAIRFSDDVTISNISIYILDADGKLITEATENQASRLLYVTPINSNGNVTITENTTLLDIEINNSISAEVNVYNGETSPNPGWLNFISIVGFGLRFKAN